MAQSATRCTAADQMIIRFGNVIETYEDAGEFKEP
jgi:hypothetical protein